jgi:uncharacterized protein (TIGR00251 family)
MISFLLSTEAKKTGVTINLKVIPAQPRFEVLGWDEGLSALKIKTRSPPAKGKANQEIEKELSKFFRSRVTLVSGLKSKKKKAFLSDKSLEDVLAKARE